MSHTRSEATADSGSEDAFQYMHTAISAEQKKLLRKHALGRWTNTDETHRCGTQTGAKVVMKSWHRRLTEVIA